VDSSEEGLRTGGAAKFKRQWYKIVVGYGRNDDIELIQPNEARGQAEVRDLCLRLPEPKLERRGQLIGLGDDLSGRNVGSDRTEANAVNHNCLAGFGWTRIDPRNSSRGKNVIAVRELSYDILTWAYFERGWSEQAGLCRAYRHVHGRAGCAAVGHSQLQPAASRNIGR